MITFKYLEAKNFMSIGDQWLHFDYKTGLSYVYGENHDVSENDGLNLISNGTGKTVVLVDAPLFALYGKTQRKIKKSEIVNIQNGSDCEVKLCFDKDGVEYLIERGLKPDKLIIIKDGVPESEEAKKRQANKIIEDEILDGISYEVFKNLIVLNGTSSKHFFEYGKNEKRVFINEVFRLGFLDYLQTTLSVEVRDMKTELDKKKIQKESKEKEIERLRNLIEANENGEVCDGSTELQSKIEEETKKIAESKKLINEIESVSFEGDLETYQKKYEVAKYKVTEVNNEIIRLNTSISNMRNQYMVLKNDYERISNESICSYCTQIIPDSLKHSLFEKLKVEGLKITEEANEMKQKKEALDLKLKSMNDWIQTANAVISNHQTSTTQLSTSTLLLQEYENQLAASVDPKRNTERVIEEITTAEKELKVISDEVNEIYKKYHIMKISRDLIGGKNFYGYYIGVFRSYLNKSINEYLEKMTSPHRIKFNNNLEADVFDGKMEVHSYDNLSTGEKSKVNLALLLSFYDVLHSFHRMETNILILDEVLDSGLDGIAVKHLHDILKEKIQINNQLCIYVVSHKGTENTFAEKEGVNKVVFSKLQGFTNIKEN